MVISLGAIALGHAAIITYLEPLGARLIGSLLLKEPITPYTVIGGLIILGSGLLLVLLPNATAPAPQPVQPISAIPQ